jgi:histidine ammonia-lyase
VVQALRATVEGPGPDRFLAAEIEAAVSFVQSGAAVAAANSALPKPLL